MFAMVELKKMNSVLILLSSADVFCSILDGKLRLHFMWLILSETDFVLFKKQA